MKPETLLAAAAEAGSKAYCPYSDFRVGAALLTEEGEIFVGCNVENASYGLTMCAERTAVGAAVSAGNRTFSALAIVSDGKSDAMPYPCGACRQVLVEFCDATLPVYVARAGRLDAAESLTLGDLLPHAFRL